MNARETFEALLAGKRVKSKHPASKYCYLDEDGVLLCDDGVPVDYFLTVNDRELYQEPNPFLVGTFQWALEEYNAGKTVSRLYEDREWCRPTYLMDDLTPEDVFANDWVSE